MVYRKIYSDAFLSGGYSETAIATLYVDTDENV